MRLNAVMEEVIAREQLKEDIMKTRFAGTNDIVETIGGRPPLNLSEFISMHRAALADDSR